MKVKRGHNMPTIPTNETISEGFINEVTLNYESKSVSVFIKTDKAIYKPREKVQLRVVVVTPSLSSKNNIPIDIQIKDGSGKRVIEWTKLYARNGVIAEELQLSGQPVFGNWTIVAAALGRNTTKTFTVAHELPTFDVELALPTYASINRSQVVATVKAFDTNGRPVKGYLTLDATKYRVITTIDGTATIPVHLVDELQVEIDPHRLYYQTGIDIKFTAKVRDRLTGKLHNTSNVINVYERDLKVELIKMSETYKPGLKYTALFKVVTQDGKPVADYGPQLTVNYGYSWDEKEWADSPLLLTPINGLIKVDLFVPKVGVLLKFKAEYMGHIYLTDTVAKADSPSGHYMQVTRADTTDITVGQDVKFIVTATEPIRRLVCEVMGRGDILWAKSLDIHTNIMDGYEFSIATVGQMAQSARVLCHYVRPDNQEVVADALNIAVALVRTPVRVSAGIRATKPGAMAGVRADASVAILGVDLNGEDVVNELKGYDYDPRRWSRRRGMVSGTATATEVFADSGAVMLSNGLIHNTPQYCEYLTDFQMNCVSII
ncbi:unnamed protein product [Medioppia subpectinata]|uniref:TEP1-F n=1 Tax=Medioppia subpectinata TaxID=1979941 RepID=A0A7R9KWH6_9ACAR|nr:unnamed protein product [Medioppia subpectinata]CAG2109802.1 unnamed protein product [Medioppia subpectinata]